VSPSKKKPRAGAGESPSLEGRLKRLEEILAQLESDEVELERALVLFEEGVALVKDAEKVLAQTQLRVEELLADGGTRPFEEGEA
jgi:exodeoxyribonuclease VII small subunit